MKRSEKIIFLLQIICIIFSILFIFLRNEVNQYIISLILFVEFLILWGLIGFEKEKIQNKK